MTATDHPNAENLATFAASSHRDGDREILRHLVECESCARIVLDLRGVVREPDLEADRGWARFREGHGPFVASAETTVRPSRALRWAAVMGLASLTLAGAIALWTTRELVATRRDLTAARATVDSSLDPQVNVPRVDALPWSSLRAASEPAVLDFGEASRLGVLRLVLLDEPPAAGMTLSFFDREGRRAAVFTDLEADGEGNLSLAVARSWLPSGPYTVRLAAESGGAVLAEYRLELRGSEAGAR